MGQRQAGALSPIVFNVYANKITDLWEMASLKESETATDTQLAHLVCANDQVLLAPTQDILQSAVRGLNYTLKLYNLQISENKPKQWECKENIGEELKL